VSLGNPTARKVAARRFYRNPRDAVAIASISSRMRCTANDRDHQLRICEGWRSGYPDRYELRTAVPLVRRWIHLLCSRMHPYGRPHGHEARVDKSTAGPAVLALPGAPRAIRGQKVRRNVIRANAREHGTSMQTKKQRTTCEAIIVARGYAQIVGIRAARRTRQIREE